MCGHWSVTCVSGLWQGQSSDHCLRMVIHQRKWSNWPLIRHTWHIKVYVCKYIRLRNPLKTNVNVTCIRYILWHFIARGIAHHIREWFIHDVDSNVLWLYFLLFLFTLHTGKLSNVFIIQYLPIYSLNVVRKATKTSETVETSLKCW